MLPIRSVLPALTRAAPPLLVAILVLALGTLVVLGPRIQTALHDLRGEATDNLHWNLAQLEVDLVQLQREIFVAQNGGGDLSALRKRFDLFYSRAQNAISGPGYATPGLEDLGQGLAATLSDFLTAATVMVDGPDINLRQNLGRLDLLIQGMHRDLRHQSVQMITRMAQLDDDRSRAFSDLVNQVALATVATVMLMAGFLGLLARANRRTQLQARIKDRISGRLTATIESAIDAIIVMDDQGRIIQYNASAAGIFGFTRSEVIGRDLAGLIVPERMRADHVAGMQRMRATGQMTMTNAGRIRTQALRRGGQEFPVELSISVVEGDDGRIFIAFLRDISDRMAAEAALTDARDEALEAERAKTEFLAVMSHEMRTPLNGVLASLEIASRLASTPEQARFIGLAQDSAQQLLRHANDVLDITRMESGGLTLAEEDFDPQQHLSGLVEAVRPLCTERGISLDFQMLGPTERLRGDAFRLGQILQNFLSNAIKFVEQGGITVEAELTRTAAGLRLLDLRVTDTGPGIAAEDQERIFDDFVMLDPSFRRVDSGAGLGLAISRRLARAMGGDIGVESATGEGSCFWLQVILPVARPPIQDTPAGAPAHPVPARNVLVVEDNATNRAVLENMLVNLGQRVVMAENGQSGARLARDRSFDLILMDVSMPVMDGLTATGLIRAGGASARARIVAVTAHSMPDDLDRFRAAGMDDVLVKPISSDRLLRMLQAPGAATQASPDDAEADIGAEEETDVPLISGILDIARLADLRAAAGDQGLSQLSATFLRDGHILQQRLRQAAATGHEAEDLLHLAHEAAGLAAVFGAVRLRAHYAQAESDLRAGDLGAARSRLLRDTEALWQATEAAMAEVI